MNYKNSQIEIQKALFSAEKRHGIFRGTEREFFLKESDDNFISLINPTDVKDYFASNSINWWMGKKPTGHMLSSQIACVNHLYPIRNDHEAVLSVARRIDPAIEGVELLGNDNEAWRGYVSFEVVSATDHLNEKRGRSKKLTRGCQCTSVDAVILARKQEKRLLIAIEWKYVERYYNEDKSKDAAGETRIGRYTDLIEDSRQLRHLGKNNYKGSLYFFEPFYQMMRQTLWAEQMVRHKDSELIKADDFINVQVIPDGNKELRDKAYGSGKMGLRSTWEMWLSDSSKYRLISPNELLGNLPGKYEKLKVELSARYWK